MKRFVIIGALLLGACNSQQQQTIEGAKAQFCPSLQAVQTALELNNVQLNHGQQRAVDLLDAACSSNQPITVPALAGYAADVAIVLYQINQKK